MVDVTMPQLGETVTEGTVTRWFKQVGDDVALDEALFEVSTDKVDTEVPSPVAGVLSEILANEGDVVEVGQVLARVGGEAGAPAPVPPRPETAAPEPPPAPPVSGTSESAGVGMVLSPVVRRLIAESGIDPATIEGTGLGGRITRSDAEQAIRARGAAPADTADGAPADTAPADTADGAPAAAADAPAPPPEPSAPTESPRPDPSRRATSVPAVVARSGDSVVPLNRIRRRTADHMVMSKQTSPHVLTAIEVDYEGVEMVRRASKQSWKAEEGFSLTYLPFIARAVVDALRDYPHLNASFGDDELIVHAGVNLAVAVDIDFQGLLAPVIQGAEGKRLRQIARDIVDLANRARSRKLSPDDLSGGTFTLTNAGQYGTMMQFPIINQPQVAILSTDGVTRKPVVVTDSFGNESIAIHSVGVLAMAWDHRAFDGAYAAAFLHRVKELIETRDWEAEIR